MSPNAGSTKWRLHWGLFRGSSLNLEWSKRGIRLDDQWMLIFWLHSESFWCMLRCYIHLGFWHVDYVDWLVLIEDSDAVFSPVLHWYIRLRYWHVGSLMIDLIALLSTLTLILSWLFWSLHMHTLTTVYHSAWHVDSLTCILFWSSLSMMFVSLFILIVIAFLGGHDWYILYSAWLYDAWLPSLCMIACRLSMWVAYLSPCLPLSSLGHFLHSGSRFCKCETLCVLVLWPR